MQATLGAPEFGSAIFCVRAFQGPTRSIVLLPAKRGVATYDRNRLAVDWETFVAPSPVSETECASLQGLLQLAVAKRVE